MTSMSTITPEPFRVEVAEDELDDLRRRLRATRWADDFGNADWTYGVERGWLREMVDYWAEEFDWRAQERAINRHPQYRVEIDGVPIHFVHVRGKGPDPTPLILTHGWPWTFWDYGALIGPLTDPAAHGGDPADAFDLVLPSLPGYGFSTPLRRTGVHARGIAGLWLTLMRDVLGYERFAAGGGDWGAIVTAELGHLYPEAVLGCHLTMATYPGIDMRALGKQPFAEDEAWMRDRLREASRITRSHATVHSVDPQTLAYALVDSPVGTAAWLWERRRAWSDCGGDILSAFDRDFLCTTASIYWLTRTIGTSLRLYHEQFNRRWAPVHDRTPVVEAPTGVAVFPKELVLLPRSVAEEQLNLRRWSVMPDGGHFAAAEQPEAVIGELRAFFREVRQHA
jgi:pimeloyl-ACP methyl ester carboxylesterase